MSEILDTRTAAARLGVGKSTLEKLRTYGGGPVYVKLSARMVRYRVTDLDEWIASRARSNTSQMTA